LDNNFLLKGLAAVDFQAEVRQRAVKRTREPTVSGMMCSGPEILLFRHTLALETEIG
jgi:hypothetical protein